MTIKISQNGLVHFLPSLLITHISTGQVNPPLPSPVKYPACMRLGAEPRVSRMAEWQILATRGDSRSVVDRAGAVSGLNLNRSSAGWLMNC